MIAIYVLVAVVIIGNAYHAFSNHGFIGGIPVFLGYTLLSALGSALWFGCIMISAQVVGQFAYGVGTLLTFMIIGLGVWLKGKVDKDQDKHEVHS